MGLNIFHQILLFSWHVLWADQITVSCVLFEFTDLLCRLELTTAT